MPLAMLPIKSKEPIKNGQGQSSRHSAQSREHDKIHFGFNLIFFVHHTMQYFLCGNKYTFIFIIYIGAI
jgi:hypothetical protein